MYRIEVPGRARVLLDLFLRNDLLDGRERIPLPRPLPTSRGPSPAGIIMVLFPFITCASSSPDTRHSTTRNRHSPRTEFCASVATQSTESPTLTAPENSNSCPTCSVPPGILRSSTTPRILRAATAMAGNELNAAIIRQRPASVLNRLDVVGHKRGVQAIAMPGNYLSGFQLSVFQSGSTSERDKRIRKDYSRMMSPKQRS